MNPFSGAHALTWEATYEIVLALMDTYPHVDLDEVGLDELCQWVIALPDFEDDPTLANDTILEEILRVWFEETTAR
jgi:FeS assembly protein IscX